MTVRDRPQNAGAAAQIGVRHRVHTSGFIELIDYQGNDAFITAAARVSFNQTGALPAAKEGEDGERSDRRLTRFLMRQRHTSPFEMARLVFYVRLPIYAARQWMRHRAASYNEKSGRYAELDAEHFSPDVFCVDPPKGANKQGRGVPLGEGVEAAASIYEFSAQTSAQAYRCLRRMRVAKEQSRMVLSVATYTEFVVAVDLHNLMHFLKLRTAAGAQAEMRAYAKAIEQIVQSAFPESYAAWVEFNRDAVTFSASAVEALTGLLAQLPAGLCMDALQKLPPRERADVVHALKLL